MNPVSGVVLAGGRGRRLGRDKAMQPVGGKPLIQRVCDRLTRVSSEILVVVADLDKGKRLPLAEKSRLVEDIFPGKGPLGGIFSGIKAAREEWSIVVACDMPFLNVELLCYMLSLRSGADAMVPVRQGRPEPTHAMYSKACLPLIHQRLQGNDLKISGFYEQIRVNYVPEEDIRRYDPDYLSFLNINYPSDLDKATKLLTP